MCTSYDVAPPYAGYDKVTGSTLYVVPPVAAGRLPLIATVNEIAVGVPVICHVPL